MTFSLLLLIYRFNLIHLILTSFFVLFLRKFSPSELGKTGSPRLPISGKVDAGPRRVLKIGVSYMCTSIQTHAYASSVPPSYMKANTCSRCGSDIRFCWSSQSPLLDNGEPSATPAALHDGSVL